MLRKRLFLTLAFLLFGGWAIIQAQVTTANITGTITDQDNEPLIGATVLAVHVPSGTVYGTTTREDGGFDLPNLRIGGPYTVEISYTGFETRKEENIYLKLGQKLPMITKLSVTETTLEGVEVVAERNPIFSNERTGAETNISSEMLNKLPTISRSAADYYRLTPSSDGNSFGGRNDQFNNFSLDGSIFNNPFGLDAATPGGQTDAQPISLDAIEQINVSVAPYDVTQAGFTGAGVNAVTKSGTNDFHGTVFGFFRNDDLTGSKVSGTDIVVPKLEQFQTGFSLGGPIIKNKLFFFVNAEVDNREDLGTTFVPDDGVVQGENVSRVDIADLRRVSNALSKYNYDPGPFEGYIHETNSTKGIFKLDFAIDQNHTLTATYNFLDADKDKPAHPSAINRRGPDATTLQFRNSGYQINNIIHSGILEWRALFGNKVSNKLQVGYTAFIDSRDPFSDPFPVINILENGIPYIIAGHEPFSIHNRLDQYVYQFTDNLNIYAGKHTFTIGTSLERFDFDNSFNLGVYTGTFPGEFWPSVEAFVDAVNSGDFDANVDIARATFETNGGDDVEEGIDQDPNTEGYQGWALAETNVGQWALYAQDEIELSDQLTLTVGLRVDLPLYFNTKDKIQENIDRNCCYDPTITYFDGDGNPVNYDHTVLPDQTPLWSPRIGFNYDLNGDQKTQIRGGTGLFSGRLPFVWLGNHVANPNFFFYNYTETDFKFPQVWRSNLGVDQDFGSGWVASVDLIYTKDINASIVQNHGLRNPTGTLPGPDDRMIYTNDDRAMVFGAPTNAYVFTNTDIGYSFNGSLQVQKRIKDGMIMLGYNYTKAEDASSIEAEISSDAYDRNPALGDVNEPVAAPSLYGIQHRIFGSAYKTFTYGNWATTISTYFQFAQGGTTQNDNINDFRFTYTYGGDINNDGGFLNDLIYIPTDNDLDQMNFVDNTSREAYRAFIEQDEYLSGRRGEYAEKYAILAPWYSDWDLRILQDYNFPVGERTHTIQLSLDFLNFGNLISSDWNVKELPATTQPVGVVGTDMNGEPIYDFDENLTSTFVDDFSLLSRWQMRVGLRYIF